uniref:F-box domain-containing protein n=1 Tax=Mycena chlorophos TaxID=658473 RepID=A0ABQ0M0N5_MYCCL|nr:predicted protein [Mycena chlorophos]
MAIICLPTDIWGTGKGPADGLLRRSLNAEGSVDAWGWCSYGYSSLCLEIRSYVFRKSSWILCDSASASAICAFAELLVRSNRPDFATLLPSLTQGLLLISTSMAGDDFPPPALFTSSHLPSDSTLASLRSIVRTTATVPSGDYPLIIDAGREDVAKYDRQMTDLQRCLDTLRNERERLQAYVDLCECVVQCWIRKLPDEMLSCIFEEYAAMEDEDAGKELASAAHMEPQYLAKKHLLELAKVCSRWHRLIIGTPSLWSYVVANPNLWPSGTGETCLSLLSASLTRSKSHPLSFDSMIVAPLSLRICGDVLRLLTEHAERWHNVSLFLDGETYPLLRDIKPLAQLKALTLRTADGPTPGFAAVPPADADLQTFTKAPNLRSLTLQGHPRNLPPLPWEQLDSFFLARAGTDLHAGLLSYLPLERLPEGAVLGLTGHPAVAPNSEPPPNTPQLCQAGSVDIELSSDRPLNQATARLAVEEILDSLVLPKAHTMSFFPRDRDPLLPWNAAAFLSLAHRSGFAQRLMSLSLFVEIMTKELVALLSAVPKLEELYITDVMPVPVDDAGAGAEREPLITDELLKALTLSPQKQQKDESASARAAASADADLTFASAVAKIPQGHGLVPNLWTLGLTSRLVFSDDALYDFADSRERERFRRNGVYFNARRALRQSQSQNVDVFAPGANGDALGESAHSAESDSKSASKEGVSPEDSCGIDGCGNFLLEIHRLSCAKRTFDDAFLKRMRGVELDGAFVMEVCDALESEEHVSSGFV